MSKARNLIELFKSLDKYAIGEVNSNGNPIEGLKTQIPVRQSELEKVMESIPTQKTPSKTPWDIFNDIGKLVNSDSIMKHDYRGTTPPGIIILKKGTELPPYMLSYKFIGFNDKPHLVEYGGKWVYAAKANTSFDRKYIQEFLSKVPEAIVVIRQSNGSYYDQSTSDKWTGRPFLLDKGLTEDFNDNYVKEDEYKGFVIVRTPKGYMTYQDKSGKRYYVDSWTSGPLVNSKSLIHSEDWRGIRFSTPSKAKAAVDAHLSAHANKPDFGN